MSLLDKAGGDSLRDEHGSESGSTNQDQRIDQGLASGQLNEREANRLNRQQEHVN